MTTTFKRSYVITVEYPEIKNSRSVIATLTNYQIKGTFKFTGLGTSASADSNKLTIFNAPEEVDSGLRGEGVKVLVRAGYEYDNAVETFDPIEHPVIFKGEVAKVKVTRSDTDKITEVVLSSALTEKKKANFNGSFDKGELLTKVLRDIAVGMNLPVIVDLNRKGKGGVSTLSKKKSWNGSVVQVLETVCREYGFKWFIQNEKVYIVDKRFLSEASGRVFTIPPGRIKGIINWTTDTTNNNTSNDVKIKADFTAFLTSSIKVGDFVKVKIKDKDETLVVDSITHTLDYWGDTWDTFISASSESRET